MRSVALKRSVTPRINSSIGMFAFRATSSGLSRGGSLSTFVVVVGPTTRLIRLVFGRSEGRVFFGVGLGTCFWGFGHNDKVSRSTFSILEEIWFRLLFMVIRKDSSWLEMFCMIACCTCVVGVRASGIRVIRVRDKHDVQISVFFVVLFVFSALLSRPLSNTTTLWFPQSEIETFRECPIRFEDNLEMFCKTVS